MPHLYLASASPRRRELLAQIGVRFEPVPADIPELPQPGEPPEGFVRRLALEKARAGRGRCPGPVLGSDTAVVVDGAILGKPRDRAEGLAMLARLSGRSHLVLTAVALVGADRAEAVRLCASTVSFRPLRPGEAEAYWATGEPADKAGGYAIQGRAAVFIERIEGSYSGVMGLPLFETAELLETAGLFPFAADPR